MHKFLFDPTAVTSLPQGPGTGLLPQQPFVLDDELASVEPLNAWLASLPSRRCYSTATWSAYADDLISWARYLERHQLRLLDNVDLLEKAVGTYRQVRLAGAPDDPTVPGQVGPSAWNRALSAMENFYDWAVDEGRLGRKPFKYKTQRAHAGDSEYLRDQQVNLARARSGSGLATLRSLAGDYADLFVDVGLGGQLPDGDADLSFHGRHAARNRSVGALVRTSGLRRTEFANLLVWEVPDHPGGVDGYVRLPVPGAIAKGSRSRETIVSNYALSLIRDYVALERSLATSSSSWQPDDALMVEEPNAVSGKVNGKRVRWSMLSIAQRRRLVAPGGGSALLFVASSGSPLHEDSWRHVFDSARDRCRKFESRFPHVSPHMLRHTFALETLNFLTRNALKRADRLAKVSGADPLLMAVLRRHEPLLVTRDFLGHRSLKTTEIYLKAQGALGVLTDAELDAIEADDDVNASVEIQDAS
jgi:site-specific recombinase XerD